MTLVLTQPTPLWLKRVMSTLKLQRMGMKKMKKRKRRTMATMVRPKKKPGKSN